MAVEMGSLCAAAAAARGLVPAGGSQGPVAGQVRCITSASLKFGSGVGPQIGPSSPRAIGYPCSIQIVVSTDWNAVLDTKLLDPGSSSSRTRARFREPGAQALKVCSDFGRDLLVYIGDGL